MSFECEATIADRSFYLKSKLDYLEFLSGQKKIRAADLSGFEDHLQIYKYSQAILDECWIECSMNLYCRIDDLKREFDPNSLRLHASMLNFV